MADTVFNALVEILLLMTASLLVCEVQMQRSAKIKIFVAFALRLLYVWQCVSAVQY